jgi:hypothetical protein
MGAFGAALFAAESKEEEIKEKDGVSISRR